MKIKIITILLIPIFHFSQEYKKWEQNDIKKFYSKQDLPYDSLDKEGEEIKEVYVPTNLKNGTYKVELLKISSKIYQLRGTNIYILFRYSPYYYSYDEGVLVVSYNSGTFYKKP